MKNTPTYQKHYEPKKDKVLNIAVCQRKYNKKLATDGNIFTNEIISDNIVSKCISILEEHAFTKIWDICRKKYDILISETNTKLTKDIKLNLFVAGEPQFTISAIKVAKNLNIDVTLWYYDNKTKTHYSQKGDKL